MISVTQNARQELKRLLDTKVDWPEARIRLLDRGRGELGLGIDIQMPGDQVVEHEGAGLLVVDSGLADTLDVTLDVEQSHGKSELVICSGS